MNKYQEALEFFTKLTNRVPLKFTSDEFCEKYDKNLVLIKELVDKATPKKPILSDSWKDEEQTDIYDENGFIDPIVSICPNCKKYGIFDFEYGEKFDYCKHCGQAIDWSE